VKQSTLTKVASDRPRRANFEANVAIAPVDISL